MNEVSLHIKSWFLALVIYLTTYLFLLLVVRHIGSLGISMLFLGSFLFSGWWFFRKRILSFLIFHASIGLFGYVIFSQIYDISYDGNTYHLGIIRDILAGGNLYVDSLAKESFWVSFYPKIIEIFFSGYASLGGVLFARIFKLTLILISCLHVFCFLRSKKPGISSVFQLFLTFLIVINPVVLYQFFTLYIDDVLFLFLLNGFLFALKKEYYFSILLFALAGGAKITYIFFGGFLFFLVLLYQTHQKIFSFHESFMVLKKNIFSLRFFSVFIFVVLVAGNQYIINTVTYKNPFYGFVGEYARIFGESMANDKPPIMALSKVHQWYYTYFSQSNIDCKTTDICVHSFVFDSWYDVKMFFTSYKMTYIYDLQTGGFGNIAGVLIVFFLGFHFFYLLYKIWKKEFDNVGYILVFSCVFFFGCLLVMPVYWARYMPFLYLIPLFGLFYISEFWKKILLGFFALNIGAIFLINIYFYGQKSFTQIYQKDFLQQVYEQSDVVLFTKAEPFNSYQEEYFWNYYGKRNLEYHSVNKYHILSLCGDKKMIDIGGKNEIYQCSLGGYLVRLNPMSFISEYAYFSKKTLGLEEFLSAPRLINVKNSEIVFGGKNYKILYNKEKNSYYFTYEEFLNACGKGKDMLGKKEWEKAFGSLWKEKNYLNNLLSEYSGSYDENGTKIQNHKLYFWLYVPEDSFENKKSVVVIDPFAENIFFKKDKNAQFLGLCREE